MRPPWSRRPGRRSRDRVAHTILVTALAIGLYLAGVGIPELWLMCLIAAWIAFLRG